MTKLLTSLVAVVLHVAGCGVQQTGSSQTTAVIAADPPPTLVVGAKIGDRLSKDVAVSGRDRLAVPNTSNWSCGRPLDETYLSNVAWLELVNGASETVSLSIDVEGLTATVPRLFVYERKNAPLRDCLTLAVGRSFTGASSVVLEPSSSVFMLLSAGGATGVYTVSARTDDVIAE